MTSGINEFHCVTKSLRRFFNSVAVALFFFCLVAPLCAQQQKPDLPDPIKFLNTYDQVLNTTRSVLTEMEFNIELDDRKKGRIVTRPYDFISGSLTASETEKVAVIRDISANWIKARYSVEAVVEIVAQRESMITVNVDIEALRRDLDGTEKWVRLDSLGVLERRVLGRISVKLLGTDAPAEPRKGFWGQKPQPVEPIQPRNPATAPIR